LKTEQSSGLLNAPGEGLNERTAFETAPVSRFSLIRSSETSASSIAMRRRGDILNIVGCRDSHEEQNSSHSSLKPATFLELISLSSPFTISMNATRISPDIAEVIIWAPELSDDAECHRAKKVE
jgi:hypothetical protein